MELSPNSFQAFRQGERNRVGKPERVRSGMLCAGLHWVHPGPVSTVSSTTCRIVGLELRQANGYGLCPPHHTTHTPTTAVQPSNCGTCRRHVQHPINHCSHCNICGDHPNVVHLTTHVLVSSMRQRCCALAKRPAKPPTLLRQGAMLLRGAPLCTQYLRTSSAARMLIRTASPAALWLYVGTRRAGRPVAAAIHCGTCMLVCHDTRWGYVPRYTRGTHQLCGHSVGRCDEAVSPSPPLYRPGRAQPRTTARIWHGCERIVSNGRCHRLNAHQALHVCSEQPGSFGSKPLRAAPLTGAAGWLGRDVGCTASHLCWHSKFGHHNFGPHTAFHKMFRILHRTMALLPVGLGQKNMGARPAAAGHLPPPLPAGQPAFKRLHAQCSPSFPRV